MPRILIDGAERAVLFQPSTGNILDMSIRQLQSVRVVETEERTETAAGDRRARRRRRELRITSPDQNLVRFAREIRDIGCGCQAIILGAETHCVFADRVNLDVKQNEQGQVGSVVGSTMQMDSTRFYADVEAGKSLLAGVPWAVSEVQIADTLARLNTRSVSFTDGVDCTSIGSGDDNFLAAFGDEFIERPITGNLLFAAGSGSEFTGVTYDGTDIIAIDNAQAEIEVWSTSATEQSRDDYYTTGDTLGSAAYHQGHGILYVVNEGNARIDVITDALDGTSVSLQRYIPIDVGQNARSIVVDQQEDELLVGMDGGEVEVWTIEGPSTSESFDSIYDGSVLGIDGLYDDVKGWDGLAIHEEALYGLTTSASEVDVVSRWQLGVLGQPTWQGRAWRVRRNVTPNIDGLAPNITQTYPARVRMIAPLINGEVTLKNTTGALDALSWSGTALKLSDSSRIGDPPQLLLQGGKYSGLDVDATSIWILDAVAEGIADAPELVVDQVGNPLDVRRGGVVADCQSRVQSPNWQNVNTVTFDVDVNSGDDLFISVTDTVGNYIGQISGESGSNEEQVKGTSATFTYENAGVFTPELVAEAFEGLTKLILGNGNKAGPDWSTIKGVDKLTDLRELEIDFKYQNSNGNDDTNMTGSPPSGWLPNAPIDRFYVDGSGLNSITNTRFDLAEWKSIAPSIWNVRDITEGTIGDLWDGLVEFRVGGSPDFSGDTANGFSITTLEVISSRFSGAIWRVSDIKNNPLRILGISGITDELRGSYSELLDSVIETIEELKFGDQLTGSLLDSGNNGGGVDWAGKSASNITAVDISTRSFNKLSAGLDSYAVDKLKGSLETWRCEWQIGKSVGGSDENRGCNPDDSGGGSSTRAWGDVGSLDYEMQQFHAERVNLKSNLGLITREYGTDGALASGNAAGRFALNTLLEDTTHRILGLSGYDNLFKKIGSIQHYIFWQFRVESRVNDHKLILSHEQQVGKNRLNYFVGGGSFDIAGLGNAGEFSVAVEIAGTLDAIHILDPTMRDGSRTLVRIDNGSTFKGQYEADPNNVATATESDVDGDGTDEARIEFWIEPDSADLTDAASSDVLGDVDDDGTIEETIQAGDTLTMAKTFGG